MKASALSKNLQKVKKHRRNLKCTHVSRRRQEAAIEKKISNLTAALAEGYRSTAILADLARFEKQLAEIRESAAFARPETFGRMRDTWKFVESRLRELQGLFSAEGRTIRAELAKHVEKITLTPDGRNYIASGTWDVLGAWQHRWCRGPESNWLRPPFPGTRRQILSLAKSVA